MYIESPFTRMISILKYPVQVINFVEKVRIQEGADYIAITNLPNIDRKMTNLPDIDWPLFVLL